MVTKDGLGRAGKPASKVGDASVHGPWVCRLVRTLQLSEACAASGYEHLRLDGLMLAAQSAAERWDEGRRCGLMFMTVGSNGLLRLGEVNQVEESGQRNAQAIGHEVWMTGCDDETACILVWTDDMSLARESGMSLQEGRLMVQCTDREGCLQMEVDARSSKELMSAVWREDGRVRRLIEFTAWWSGQSFAVN